MSLCITWRLHHDLLKHSSIFQCSGLSHSPPCPTPPWGGEHLGSPGSGYKPRHGSLGGPVTTGPLCAEGLVYSCPNSEPQRPQLCMKSPVPES